MAVGFILIKTEPSKEQQVYEALGSVEEIVELHPLFGEFDLMAKVNTSDFYDLGQVGAWRHHPPRCQAALRLRRGDRPEADGDNAQGVRRRV